METTATSFSTRSNAKRAAEQMIAKGVAPAVDYGIERRDNGRFEIVWKTALTSVAFAETLGRRRTEPAGITRWRKSKARGGRIPVQALMKLRPRSFRLMLLPTRPQHRVSRDRSRRHWASRHQSPHSPNRKTNGQTAPA